MRKGTQAFVGIVSLGLLAAGYQAGLAAEVSNGFSAAPVSTGSASGSNSISGTTSIGNTSAGSETLNTAAPLDGESTPAPTSTPATSSAPTPKSTSAAPASTPKATTSAPAPVAIPKATPSASSSTTSGSTSGSTSAGTTKTGAAINYRYGTVQVSVTKANGKITAVNLLQQGATGGRQGAFSYLVDYAIQANGSSFGNLGGATYTTDAFKQSLESALAKF